MADDTFNDAWVSALQPPPIVRVWTSSVGSGPPGAIYIPTPKQRNLSPALLCQVLKESSFKTALPCVAHPRALNELPGRGGGVGFLLLHSKALRNQARCLLTGRPSFKTLLWRCVAVWFVGVMCAKQLYADVTEITIMPPLLVTMQNTSRGTVQGLEHSPGPHPRSLLDCLLAFGMCPSPIRHTIT